MVLPALAVLGVGTGLSWKLLPVSVLEDRAALAWNRAPLPALLDRILAGLRPLGNKWAWLAAVGALIVADVRSGLWLAAGAAGGALVERLTKSLIRRPRPFTRLPDIRLRQSPAPVDTSFPSGDAMRVWFVVCAVEIALPQTPLLVRLAVWGAAVLVSLGRVRLGAHYPMDVWAGAWIGIGFAAIVAWLAV
ncbi:MAG TPA: phosphatase PAP2 family protein [Anaerolineales bacterium]|nr:phosphatase PAP2 family protein [Anaerolineales bacterium]